MCSKKKLLEYDKKDKKRCHIDLGTEDIYIYILLQINLTVI